MEHNIGIKEGDTGLEGEHKKRGDKIGIGYCEHIVRILSDLYRTL